MRIPDSITLPATSTSYIATISPEYVPATNFNPLRRHRDDHSRVHHLWRILSAGHDINLHRNTVYELGRVNGYLPAGAMI